MESKQLVQNYLDAKEHLKNTQSELLKYCQESDDSLDQRFRIWSKYVDKIHHPFVTGTDSPVISELIQLYCDWYEPLRGREVDWEELFEQFRPAFEAAPERINEVLISAIAEIREKKLSQILDGTKNPFKNSALPNSVDEFDFLLMEHLIQTNFGSFRYEW
ncbi:hypothetical protein EBU71_18970 [bacterium]|nr:hypothetical protein [Candidatus Elulimicrobium humile]